ncbi:MAG: S24 family peptidase [Gammaproteobacteria bacterium]|nr:S24 family peptidase [Gammaproteobacteria bacterium]
MEQFKGTQVNFTPDIKKELMESSCSGTEPFALQVLDDSMEPEFKKGCIIIIDASATVKHECYVMASVENGYIFRQLLIEEDKYFIAPLNDAYMHEKREIEFEALEGVIVQQASPKGKRSERKRYE